jgi:hypothetical protein
MNKGYELIPIERIQNFIFLIRGEKVMLDSHLAELYGVDTGTLNRAVKRNIERFPDDFVFQLEPQEVANLKCQFGISSSEHGGRRRSIPYVFTEQGVAMLSNVLRSKRAAQVNVAIMRAFVSLRRLLATNEVLARKLAELERRLEGHDQAIKSLFDAMRELMAPSPKPKREISFHAIGKEPADEVKTISERKILEHPASRAHLSFYAPGNGLSLTPCFSWVFSEGKARQPLQRFSVSGKPLKRF